MSSLEESVPIDFGCVCLYDRQADVLTVTCVGAHSEALAGKLALATDSQFRIDQKGLFSCVSGQLVYEEDISHVPFPFPRRLAGGGLRAMVAAPLIVENQVFRVLIAARCEADTVCASRSNRLSTSLILCACRCSRRSWYFPYPPACRAVQRW